MDALAARVAAAIGSVCPIVGLRIGKGDDKSTWQIEFAEEATAEQREAALEVINGFDFDAPPVPASVTPRQARLAIEAVGLTAQVEAAVDQAGTPARIAWDYALEIRRDDSLLVQLAQAVGLSSAALDQLFVEAAEL